jgi:hypothetical protein
VERMVTADVPFGVIGVPFRRGLPASSAESVSVPFIHTNDMPLFPRFYGFPLAGKCSKTPTESASKLTMTDRLLRCASR